MSGGPIQNAEPPPSPERLMRPVGGTEYSWCMAVPAGTGITVLALLLSKPPDSSLLLSALRRLQTSHPILRSKLRFSAAAASFTFLIPPDSNLVISAFDLESMSNILDSSGERESSTVTRFQLILEHEMSRNTWRHLDPSSDGEWDLLHVSLYSLEESRWALALRVHAAACDRTAAAAVLLRELMAVVGGVAGKGNIGEEEGVYVEIQKLGKDS